MKSDDTLVRACLAGDKRSWERLIERYSRLLYSIPLRYGLNQEDAADIFQSVCVKLLSHLEDLKNDQHLTGWLILTTRRECLYYLRQRKRYQSRYQESDEDQLALLPADDLAPDKRVVQFEEEQQVRGAVEEMGARCRQLVHMLYLAVPVASYAQVSQELNIPLGAIGPTRGRCLKALKDRLVRNGF